MRSRRAQSWCGLPSEALERRLLLSATDADPTDVAAVEAELEAQAVEAQGQYTSSGEQYVDDSIANFVSDTAASFSEPDYDAVVNSSPIGSLYSSSPLSAAAESASSDSAQELEAAENSAAEAQSTEGALTDSYPGVDSVFSSDTSLSSYASNLLPDSSGSGGGTEGSTSSSDSTSTDDDTTTTGSGDTAGDDDATDGDSADTEPSDPRMAWTPHVLPETVEFDNAEISLQNQLDSLLTVEPSETESFETTTVTERPTVTTATDEQLGEGEKVEDLKTSVTESLEYNAADDWVLTQTVRTDYSSTEESQDADDVDTDITRESWTEFSITVINGTRSVVTFTSFDSFSYGQSSEYDNSQQDDADETGDAANDQADDSEDDSEDDEGLDTDEGNFESSLKATSTITITFQNAIIENPDGTSSLLVTLSRSTNDTYNMALEAGFGVEDSEGTQVLLDEDEDDSDSDQPADNQTADSGDVGDSDDSPELPDPEHGGNGSDIGAGSSVSLSSDLAEASGISVGAIIPMDGSMDDVPEAEVFGRLSFGHGESSSGDVAQSFRLGSQMSDGLTEDDSDTHSYFSVDLSSASGGASGLNFNIETEFGEIPTGLDSLPGADDDDIPEPILGGDPNDGAGDGADDGGLNLGFGVSMADHGNSTSSISISEKTRDVSPASKLIATKSVRSASSSGSGTSFDFGFGEDGDITLDISVTQNSNHGVMFVSNEYEWADLGAPEGHIDTVELWQTETYTSIGDVGITLTIGLNTSGEVEVDVGASVTKTDLESLIRTTQSTQKGPGYNNKYIQKFWFKKGQTVGKNENGDPILTVIDVTGFRSESINASSGSSIVDPPPEDNGTEILLDALENSLDVAGMTPGVGIIPDLLAVGLATARGKWGTAAISLAAALPGIGLAAGAGKLASKGGKQIAKASDNLVDAGQAAANKVDDLVDGIKKACDSKTGNCFIAGTQVVVARRTAEAVMAHATLLANPLTNAQDSPLRHTTVALDVGGEENLDAYYAAGALALGVGLSAKPRRKRDRKPVRRRLFGR